MLPPGFEPGIIGLRSQYAWPDYTTGACKNQNQLQFKAIAGFRKPPAFTLMVKNYHFETLYKIQSHDFCLEAKKILEKLSIEIVLLVWVVVRTRDPAMIAVNMI